MDLPPPVHAPSPSITLRRVVPLLYVGRAPDPNELPRSVDVTVDVGVGAMLVEADHGDSADIAHTWLAHELEDTGVLEGMTNCLVPTSRIFTAKVALHGPRITFLSTLPWGLGVEEVLGHEFMFQDGRGQHVALVLRQSSCH